MAQEEPINRLMRDLLIEHIDQKPLPVTSCMELPVAKRDSAWNRHCTLLAAWRRGYIDFDRYPSPKLSTISPKGRSVLATALADWADAMMRAGESNPLLPNVSGEIAEAEELAKSVEL